MKKIVFIIVIALCALTGTALSQYSDQGGTGTGNVSTTDSAGGSSGKNYYATPKVNKGFD